MRKTIYIAGGMLVFLLLAGGVAEAKPRKSLPDSLLVLQIPIGSDTLRMRYVEGGLFLMGATSEQRSDAATERPVHTVVLDNYYIAETEVTQAVWEVVMGEWETMDEWHNPQLPVTDISWYEAQEFVRQLDSITGMPFRLPTEAEWEFAARGGNGSKGFRFAGGNIADSVGWGLSNAGFRKHPVAQKKPNELGLYDMTGNVSEWCEDWYAPYAVGAPPNPKGAETGEWKIQRGGSFDNCEANRHISFRWYSAPSEATNYCGFRLALTIQKDTSVAQSDPALVQRIRVGKRTLKMLYVPAEQPYYIAETDVTCGQWKRVMHEDAEGKNNEPALDIPHYKWDTFLEQCRKESKVALAFATEEEIATATALGVVIPARTKRSRQKRWEKDAQSIQKHRRAIRSAKPWAELIGIRLSMPDDPILQSYTDSSGNKTPIRLIIRLAQ